jgi:hypothetical protein
LRCLKFSRSLDPNGFSVGAFQYLEDDLVLVFERCGWGHGVVPLMAGLDAPMFDLPVIVLSDGSAA